ncbi:MAG: hypothetical protein AB7V36_14485 [Bacteroidales bacterium]|nr:hypothetical protein [Bacteroidales bacterium]
MKNYSKIIMLLAISTGLFSCKCNKIVEKQQDTKQIQIIKTEFGEKMATEKLPYTIDTVWVDGLTLHTILTYTGEKTDVSFVMAFNGAWLKSYPPKAYLNILPSVAATEGKKQVKHHLVYDLTPLSSGNPYFEVYVTGYKQGFRIGGE